MVVLDIVWFWSFFFFKQKTAYEMRISDWSSDVCSSDLATQDAPVHENVKRALVEATELDTRLVMRPLRNTERVLNNPGVEKIRQKIGRASCRARVCQYV